LFILAGIAAYYAILPGQDTKKSLDVREVKARVLTAENTEVRSSGLSHIGYQTLEIKLLEGEFKGKIVPAVNNLSGQTDLENLFKKDDKIIAAVILENGAIEHVKAVDLFRQDTLLSLFCLFVAALLLYAGVIGIKALISFVFTVVIIWEVLIQQILDGHNPLVTTTYTIILLSAIIIFLVAGINRKGITAFIGTISGLFVTLFVTLYFGREIGLFGMTQPYVNALIFSGYYDLDIRQIFYSAVILGASGAAMDIAMDISASMDEVKNKKPDISPMELIQSGFNVGRHVIGTMATTLLLAYSGGYLTLLMIFKVKEPSIMRMLNMKIVAAEIMRTLVGSIGLVMVAPITAIVGGIIIGRLFKKN
jgi:uncharacterized membrane protein